MSDIRDVASEIRAAVDNLTDALADGLTDLEHALVALREEVTAARRPSLLELHRADEDMGPVWLAAREIAGLTRAVLAGDGMRCTGVEMRGGSVYLVTETPTEILLLIDACTQAAVNEQP